MEPSWWEWILGSDQWVLELTFWTLYVEFKFYVFAALFYYLRGSRFALTMLFIAFALGVLERAMSASADQSGLGELGRAIRALSFEHFGWFTCGALLYRLSKDGSSWHLSGALSIGLATAVFAGQGQIWWTIAYTMIVALFTAAVVSPRMQYHLSSPPLLFFGFISYPLYLIHENIMVSMILTLKRMWGDQFFLLCYGLPICLVTAMGWYIAKYIEPWVRARILEGLSRLRVICGNGAR